MRVLGIEANIGSMLYPFQEAGHEVIGNYDSRGIVNEKNFKANFPNSVLFPELDDIISVGPVDVLMSQPSCSKFSQLSRRDKDSYSNDSCVDLSYEIAKHKPKFFFIESKLDYIYEMPQVKGYKIQLEWVSNYHYGNTQKGRNRLWVMGIRDDIDWKFIPNEQHHSNTVKSVLEGLPETDDASIDHVHMYKPFLKDSIKGEYLTLDEAFEMLQKDGRLSYTALDGNTKHRINRKMANPITSTTITGGGTWFHWEKKYPLTVREKARIQGFPDEFSFAGLSATKKDKAVGKSMPMEFTSYLVGLLDGSITVSEPKKVVPDPLKLVIFKQKQKK